MKVARCEARSAIVENTRVRRAVSGWFASSRPECARDVIGASELLSSCAMTRITFFQIATSCAAISRVSCLKSSSRCGWLFSVKGRLLRWKISASAPSDTVNRVSTPPATASRSTCGASSSSSPKRMPSILRPARNSCRAAMLPKTMWSFALVSTSASGVVCTTVSRRSSRWYRSRRSRRRLSPSELYSAVRSPISSGPVAVTLTLKSRSRRLPMPSATARRLRLQRSNMRFVSQAASGSVTSSAAPPARTGDSSQRSKAIVTAATAAAVAATTTAMRPASDRWARGLLAIRPPLLARDPPVELRIERGERQHAVLEQHLVECAHVELLPELRLRPLAHLVPLHAAERVRKHEPGKTADERHRFLRPLRRTQRHRLLQVLDRLLRRPASHLHAEVHDHHRRDRAHLAADVVAVRIVEADLVGEILGVGLPAFARAAEEQEARNRVIALAPVLREELDLQVMARQRLVQDHVLQRRAIEIRRDVAVVISRGPAAVVRRRQVLPARSGRLLEFRERLEHDLADRRRQYHLCDCGFGTLVGALGEVADFIGGGEALARIAADGVHQRLPVVHLVAEQLAPEADRGFTLALHLLLRDFEERHRIRVDGRRRKDQGAIARAPIGHAFDRSRLACMRQIGVPDEVAIARDRGPYGSLDDLFPLGGEGRRLVAGGSIHQRRLSRVLREHLVKLSQRRPRGRFRRRIAEALALLEVCDLPVDPRPELAPARQRLGARLVRPDRLDARNLRQRGLPAECRDAPQLVAAKRRRPVLLEGVIEELPGHPLRLRRERLRLDRRELGRHALHESVPARDVLG